MKRPVVQLAAAAAGTIFFLAVAFYRTPLAQVSAAIGHADPRWIAGAIAVYAGNLALRSLRWQLILRPVAPLSYRSIGEALLVGYGLNTIMPARLGELARIEFLNRSSRLPRVWGVTSIVVERLCDGVAVVGCLAIGLLVGATANAAGDVLDALLVTGGSLFAAVLVAAWLLSGSAVTRFGLRFPRLAPSFDKLRCGFAILRSGRQVLWVAGLTLAICVPDALTAWCVVKAAGLTLGPFQTMVLVGAAALSSLVPAGPAYLGTLQFAYALAVEFAGGNRALGIAAATLDQLFVLLPVAIIAGLILLGRSGSQLLLSGRDPNDKPA